MRHTLGGAVASIKSRQNEHKPDASVCNHPVVILSSFCRQNLAQNGGFEDAGYQKIIFYASDQPEASSRASGAPVGALYRPAKRHNPKKADLGDFHASVVSPVT